MSIVNDTPITGRQYERIFRITCENPLAGNHSITFERMRVIEIPGMQPVETYIGPITEGFSAESAAQEFPMRDPATGELTGETVTDGQLFAMLYSRSIHAMAKADAPVEVPQEVPEEPEPEPDDLPPEQDPG